MASESDPTNQQNTKGSSSSGPRLSKEDGLPAREPVVYRNTREYAQALRLWLWQYHNMSAMHSFTSNLASQMAMQTFANIANNNMSCLVDSNYTPGPGRWRPDPYASRRMGNVASNGLSGVGVQNGMQETQQPAGQANLEEQLQNHHHHASQRQEGPPAGVMLKVPTFWKRVVAELIDFTLLFYIKMFISICLITEFSWEDLSFVSSDDLLERITEMDYDQAFAITFEIIALEIFNRVLITLFETLYLYRRAGGGQRAGATPGKRLLGLKVVSCDSVQTLGHSLVMVAPAGNISLRNAFLRSVIKNFTIAFFLPACLTLFFFKHNRTLYDVIAHTIVVEEER